MKETFTLMSIIGLSALLAACSSHKIKNESIVGSYVLTSANGKDLPKTIQPVINFSESNTPTEIKVNGKMCNLFNGDATYQEGVLKGHFMMTRALCSEPILNELDNLVGEMFNDGATIEKQGEYLLLRSGKNTLVYQQQNLPMTHKDNTK